MKVNNDDKDVSGEFKLNKTELKKIKEYVLYGVPAKDGKGAHPYFFNCRIRENQSDLIRGIRENIPGWWKNNADLQRSIVAAGTYLILCYMGKTAKVDDLVEILDDMNILAKHKRLKGLKEDIQQLRLDAVNSDMNPKVRAATLRFVDAIEKKVEDLF